jgi:hypothetical protein
MLPSQKGFDQSISISTISNARTLDEVNFFMDNQEVARAYEKQCRKIFPSFKIGGETVWQKDLIDYKKR